MTSRAIVATAVPANLAAVLARLARDAVDPESAFEDLNELVEHGTLSASDFIAVQAESDPQFILGAIMTQRMGGAQGAVWMPVADDEPVRDALARNAVRRLRDLGCRVLQALAPIGAAVSSLERAGFEYLTDLVFLEADIQASTETPRLTCRAATPADLTFAETIERTYEGTQDMPELNGTRTTAEILVGCLATRHEPHLFYAERYGETAGVLHLTPLDEPGDIELTYMGLVPEARGYGLGRDLAFAAFRIAASLGGTRLHLTYDVRNLSAENIYSQLGFVEQKRRAVWINFCRDSRLHSQGLRES